MLNLTIALKGTDWRDEILGWVPLKLREQMSEQVKTEDETMWSGQLLAVEIDCENFQQKDKYWLSIQERNPIHPQGKKNNLITTRKTQLV